MVELVEQETRSQNEFLCVDSAPKKYASLIPIWRAPAVCISFIVIGYLSIFIINEVPILNTTFPDDDIIFSKYTGTHSIPMRLFVFSFSLAFCCFCNGSYRNKSNFFFDIISTYTMYCAVFDIINLILNAAFGLIYPLSFVEIASGLLGFWVFSLKLLQHGRMPPKIEVPYKPQRTFQTLFRLIVGIIIAGSLSFWVGSLNLVIIQDLRNFALLGGIGPGVFLFLPILFLLWFALATYDRSQMKTGDFSPPLTFVVPAHNEEYIIADTIFAMDAAAENYSGDVIILIMNNNSDDKTREISLAALDKCHHASGKVIDVLKPGKSNALNAGLAATETEFIVRVDADTLIAPDSIQRAMRYFYDAKVGVVGGLPIPPGGAMFDRARFLEVIVKHGYYSVALGAINGVVGVPGMLALYRTELPRQLGGFVEGMNGEDTDMSLRIGEMGYEVVVDPKVTYISEVPATYKHMREQRMRWFRSIYHISSRNGDYLDRSWLTIRGKIILPYMLVNSARRAMLTPLVMFGIIEYLTHFDSANTLQWQAILAVLIGAPAIVAVFATFINGYPRGIFALPDYLVFRAIRAYLTLESLLSIIIAPDPKDIKHKVAKQKNPTNMLRQLRNGFIGVTLSLIPVNNAASGESKNNHSITSEISTGAHRQGLIVEEDNVFISDLATSIFVDSSFKMQKKLRHRDNFFIMGNVRTDLFTENTNLNTLRLRGDAGYRFYFKSFCKCWMQSLARLEYKTRDQEFLFIRQTLRTKFQANYSNRHIGYAQIDLSNLDYNDQRLKGFDQRKYRSEFGHLWRIPDFRFRTNGSFFFETSDADAVRFDSQSWGLKLNFQKDLLKKTKLGLSLLHRQKIFEGIFSSSFPITRYDELNRTALTLSHRLQKHLYIIGEIGWEENRSTVPIRDYDGVTFLIALKAKLF